MHDVSVIVPTVGCSPFLEECLSRLRKADAAEIVLVVQGGLRVPEASQADRTLRLRRNLGFAAGCNHALAETSSGYVALVNDDLLVEDGWLATLVEALADPSTAAVQGVNLQLDRPELVDGCGVAWNRFLRPVQIGRGLPDPRLSGSREIFGASATAAVYRRSALESVALRDSEIFDSRLISYYEDVELSTRLRKAGFTSYCDGRARALHAGSTTARRDPLGHLRLLVSNRYLVLARALGRRFRSRWPWLLARDLLDLVALAARLRHRAARGLLAGLVRAVRELRHFAHDAPCQDTIAALERFRLPRAAAWPPEWRVAAQE